MRQTILDAFGSEPGYTFFTKYFPGFREGGNVKCPFHNDTKPSMSIMPNGGWKCFACGEKGDIFSFYGLVNGFNPQIPEDFKSILEGIINEFNLALPRQGKFDEYVNILRKAQENIKDEDLLKEILLMRGWDYPIIKQLGIGFMKGRLWLPIYRNKVLVNIRQYDYLHKTTRKFLSLKGSDYPTWIFPNIDYSQEKSIFIFKETDVPLAIQIGLPAISLTCGEGAYNRDLDYIFQGKTVYICYDTDKKGVGGQNIDPAEVFAKQIYDIAQEIRICELPVTILPNGEHADFTDFVISGTDFLNVIDSAKKFVQKKDKELTEEPRIDIVNFKQSINAHYYDKQFKVDALCIGLATATYVYPSIIRYECKIGTSERCTGCGMALHSGKKIIRIDNKINLLELIAVTNQQQFGILRRAIGAADKCRTLSVNVEQMGNIEEIFITERVLKPQFNTSVSTQKRKAFCLGTGIIPNRSYTFTGTLTSDPRNQEAVNFFKTRETISSDVDNFRLSKEDVEALDIFKVNGTKALQIKIQDIKKDIQGNVTKIIERNDVLLVTLLTYMSPLSFKFNKATVSRGWMETLIFGDTQTGKSETVKKLMEHLEVGAYHLCEKTTHAGLVGGVTYIGKSGLVVWGILPINDRGLVVLDEISGLSLETMGKLTGVRDNGLAESNTVEGIRQALARTRKIWIGNPRSSRPLKGYNSGVQAAKELIGLPEDIARFDLIVVCSSDDVSIQDINMGTIDEVEPVFTKDKLLHKLVLWAWSRQDYDFIFDEASTQLILQYATEMSETYTDDFPIVLGSQQRFKLSRLSIAIAILSFSTNNLAEKVFIKPWHVQYARQLMEELFAKPAFGYKHFSLMRTEHTINKGKVIAKFNALDKKKRKTFTHMLMEGFTFSLYDIRAFLGCTNLDKQDGNEMLNFLIAENCIIKASKNGFRKTPGFTTFLKDIVSGTEVPF